MHCRLARAHHDPFDAAYEAFAFTSQGLFTSVSVPHPRSTHAPPHRAELPPKGRAADALGTAQHHDGVARRGHEVVALLHHLAVLAVVEAEFLKPIGKVAEPQADRNKTGVWLDVLLYTGLHRGDAVRLGPQHVTNGLIYGPSRPAKL